MDPEPFSGMSAAEIAASTAAVYTSGSISASTLSASGGVYTSGTSGWRSGGTTSASTSPYSAVSPALYEDMKRTIAQLTQKLERAEIERDFLLDSIATIEEYLIDPGETNEYRVSDACKYIDAIDAHSATPLSRHVVWQQGYTAGFDHASAIATFKSHRPRKNPYPPRKE